MWGQGFPGAPETCASAEPQQSGLRHVAASSCLSFLCEVGVWELLLAPATNWGELGRGEGRRGSGVQFSARLERQSGAVLPMPQSWALPSVPGCSAAPTPWLQSLAGGDVVLVEGPCFPPTPLSTSLPHSGSSPSAVQVSKRRSASAIPVATIDLTEEDSQDSCRSSSTLSGSSSQEGQNGSAELGAEDPESRDGIVLEYQVRRGKTAPAHTEILCPG